MYFNEFDYIWPWSLFKVPLSTFIAKQSSAVVEWRESKNSKISKIMPKTAVSWLDTGHNLGSKVAPLASNINPIKQFVLFVHNAEEWRFLLIAYNWTNYCITGKKQASGSFLCAGNWQKRANLWIENWSDRRKCFSYVTSHKATCRYNLHTFLSSRCKTYLHKKNINRSTFAVTTCKQTLWRVINSVITTSSVQCCCIKSFFASVLVSFNAPIWQYISCVLFKLLLSTEYLFIHSFIHSFIFCTHLFQFSVGG